MVHTDTVDEQIIDTWCDGIDFYHNTLGTKIFTMVPPEKYCPVAPKGLKEVEQPIAHEYIHTKLPRMWCWPRQKEEEELSYLRMRFLREAKIFELFRGKNGHPNICTYHGCIIKDGLIRGICMSKYKYTLTQAVNPNRVSKRCFQYGVTGNRLECGRQIYEDSLMRGLQRLHSMGYVHADLKPDNIMLRNDGTCVIIDFDSCVPINTSTRHTIVGRTSGWHNPEVKVLTKNVDFDAFDEIKTWLSDKKPYEKQWLFQDRRR